MIWLVWRRYRAGILGLTLYALALAAYLVISGWTMRAAYYHGANGQSAASCAASQSSSALCKQLGTQWNQTYEDPPDLLGLYGIAAAPALIGMFLGAPLVAGELERGTQRLIWTQGVTRTRWLLAVIGALGGPALLLGGVVEAAVWYWLGPYRLLGNYFGAFDTIGFAPLAYTAFALALGLAMGALVRRVVPAMLLTLVGFMAVRGPIALFARPRYLPPLTLTWDPYLSRMAQSQPGNQDWALSSMWLDAGGHPLIRNGLFGPTPGGAAAGPGQCDAAAPWSRATPANVWNGWDTLCAHTSGWRYQDIWQPASRFWLFQGIESAIFLALAMALLALAVWLVRRALA